MIEIYLKELAHVTVKIWQAPREAPVTAGVQRQSAESLALRADQPPLLSQAFYEWEEAQHSVEARTEPSWKCLLRAQSLGFHLQYYIC